MGYLKIGVVIIGLFLIGLGTYSLIYKHAYFSLEQIVNIDAIREQSEESFPDFFGAALIVAGVVLVISELIVRNNKDN